MSALDLVPILKQHRPFAWFSSFGLALLYAEEAWASYNIWPRRALDQALLMVALVTAIASAGYLLSFLAPPLLVSETWDHSRAWGVFSNVTAWSAGITVAVNVLVLGCLLYLVDLDLVATYTLLRDLYVYTFSAILFFHGMLLYVRYMTFLYRTPGHLQPTKVIATSAAVGVLILIVVGFLFTLDIRHLETALPSEEGMLGLHVYGRFLYLLSLLLAAYAWHLRWIADH